MKSLTLFIATLFVSSISFGQTTATDVTVTDCEGGTVNLFTELDAGKIIVIGWTMPCASCAVPLLAVHNEVLNYAISNPGIVEFWLTDDYANTGCNTIQNWCTTNGITTAKYFSTSDLDMMDYGSNGMPKVVVLGCSSHNVYYNVNNSPTAQGAGAAIDAALADIAISCTTGIGEVDDSEMLVSCFPNPATSVLNVSIELLNAQNAVVEVVGLNGEVYSQVSLENLTASKNEIQINTEKLSAGLYFLKVSSNDVVRVEKFQVN